MKERILEFLRNENKTSSQLAEDIGVQPSGISHIISGRNNPSLDFVIKMLEKYSYLSAEWLLFGRGSMYKEPRMADLFSNMDLPEPEPEPRGSNKPSLKEKLLTGKGQLPVNESPESILPEKGEINVKRIVWFYENGSFDEFYPRKS
jgi:transcriptional regulator with XRE-family HTH domain